MIPTHPASMSGHLFHSHSLRSGFSSFPKRDHQHTCQALLQNPQISICFLYLFMQFFKNFPNTALTPSNNRPAGKTVSHPNIGYIMISKSMSDQTDHHTQSQVSSVSSQQQQPYPEVRLWLSTEGKDEKSHSFHFRYGFSLIVLHFNNT